MKAISLAALTSLIKNKNKKENVRKKNFIKMLFLG